MLLDNGTSLNWYSGDFFKLYSVLSTKKKRNVYVPEKKEMEDMLRTMIEEHLGVVAPGPYQATEDLNIVAHIFNCVAWQGSHYVNIVKLMCILQKHLEDFTFHVVL